MSNRAVSWLIRSLLALALLLGTLGCLLLVLNERFPPPSGETLLAFVTFLIVGVVIASRRPENPIGWMFCVIGLASVSEFFAQEYAVYTLETNPGALPGGAWMAWTQTWTATIVWSLMFLALLLFPTGRLPSPRWRPVAWVVVGASVLAGVLAALEPGRLQAGVPNPTGVGRAGGIIETSMNVLIFVFLGVVLAIAASVIVRYGRARGEERQQLKWLAYTVGFWAGSLGLGLVNFGALRNPLVEFVVGILGVFVIAAVPAAIGVAILRHRLYDIDVVINRTLVYGALTATLAVVYFAAVALMQLALRPLTGGDSQLAIVASTLAIAALFSPLRRRLQALIDRRFYRRKYDARETVEAFSARLRDATDLRRLDDELVGVVRATVEPEHLSFWLRTVPGPPGDRGKT